MQVKNVDNITFNAIRGRNFQNYTTKQRMLIDKLEEAFDKPLYDGSKVSYMNELDKKNVDVYLKPSVNDNEVKVTLFKRNGKYDIKRIGSLGFVNANDITNIPKRALNLVKKDDETIKPLHIVGMLALIAGLTSLIYLFPNKSAKDVLKKTVDTVMVQKNNADAIMKDTLKLF